MKNVLCASNELLKRMSSRQIIGIANRETLDYFRRRGMLRVSGKRYLIGLPEEMADNTGTFVQIGGYIRK